MKKLEQLGRSLSKQDQKFILGGYQPKSGGSGSCNISYYGGSSGDSFTAITASGSCSDQSAAANAYCVKLIDEGRAARCGYDCGCDGYGV